jgi:bifunctional non-homologous end joining protein LigD
VPRTRALSFIDFMLPTLVEEPPLGDDWIHEIKYDGYRTQLILQDGKVRAYTRRGADWTGRYGPIVEAASVLPAEIAVIDGEVVALDKNHRSDINQFREALQWNPARLIFVAFDLLHLDGVDLRPRRLLERKERLQHLIRRNPAIQYSEHVAGGGAEFHAAAERMGLEGMVSKRPESRYKSGRTEAWLKTKCYEESTYEVAAVLREPGRPAVAYMVTPDKDRRYVGGAFISLPPAIRERLYARVHAKAHPVKGVTAKPGAEWLKPGLQARVRHLRGEDMLRHASLKGLIEE